MEENDSKEMHFLSKEEEDKPQEVKEWEQKRIEETKDGEKKDLQETKDGEKKDIEEIQDDGKNDLIINNTFKENDSIVTTGSATKEIKEYNTNNLVLNYYWILVVSKISISITMIIYELVGFYLLLGVIELLDYIWPDDENKGKDDEEDFAAFDIVTLLVFKVGAKWLFFITIGKNLAIAFFCLTNFSKVLKDTKSNLKFYISNIIKFIVFYIITVLILDKLISGYAYDKLIEEIKKIKLNSYYYGMVLEIVDKVRDIVVRYVGDFLGSFNNSLDQMVFKTIYILLFSAPPKFVKEKYRKYYRFLSLIPIIYIIICLILRALNNKKTIELSIYATPFLVGSKFTIFGFYITTLLYIKIRKNEYKMFDEEGNLLPEVFATLSSKIFAIFGAIELFFGFFSSIFSKLGFGNNYLIIVCAPLLALYDYKRDYKLHIRPCKNKNSGPCLNIAISLIFYPVIIILGLVLFSGVIVLLDEYIIEFVKFIIENAKDIIKILKEF